MSERGILVLKLDDAPPVTLAAHELRAHAATIPAAPDVENVAMARESAAPVANYGYRRRYAPTCCAPRATGYEPSRVTPSELRARAANELQRLGPSPATTRARVQWRRGVGAPRERWPQWRIGILSSSSKPPRWQSANTTTTPACFFARRVLDPPVAGPRPSGAFQRSRLSERWVPGQRRLFGAAAGSVPLVFDAFSCLRAGTPPAMRRVRVRKKDGLLYLACRKCGCPELLATDSERGRRTQHLKCAQCGEPQRYRQPKGPSTVTGAAARQRDLPYADPVSKRGDGERARAKKERRLAESEADRAAHQDRNEAFHCKAEAIHWTAAAIHDHAAEVGDEHAQHTVKDETGV